MSKIFDRREFLKISAAGSALCLAGPNFFSGRNGQASSKLISPGCRGTKVKVAKIYMGVPDPHWPKPTVDLDKEIQYYESRFAEYKDELSARRCTATLATSSGISASSKA